MYGMQPEFQSEVHVAPARPASTSGPVRASSLPDLRTSFQENGSLESPYEKNPPDHFRYKTKSECYRNTSGRPAAAAD
jgi:hypothetical protein